MSELKLKPIPNIVNVDDIQEIIETNKRLIRENKRLNNIIKDIVLECFYSDMSTSEFKNIYRIAFNDEYNNNIDELRKEE